MRAYRIVELLATRHRKDIFVSECCAGPMGRGVLRMDALALKRSWTSPLVWGYEVKVTRADFLKDTKWTGYLAFCNAFSFVAPAGVIDAAELPPEAGLIVPSKNLTRLYTKKKAPERQVEIPEWFWRGIIMNRCRVYDRHADPEAQSGLEYWRAWLAEKEEKRRIGYEVAKGIRERVTSLEDGLRSANHRCERLKRVGEFVKAQGIDIWAFDLKSEINEHLSAGLSDRQRQVLTHLAADVKRVRQGLLELREDSNKGVSPA